MLTRQIIYQFYFSFFNSLKTCWFGYVLMWGSYDILERWRCLKFNLNSNFKQTEGSRPCLLLGPPDFDTECQFCSEDFHLESAICPLHGECSWFLLQSAWFCKFFGRVCGSVLRVQCLELMIEAQQRVNMTLLYNLYSHADRVNVN